MYYSVILINEQMVVNLRCHYKLLKRITRLAFYRYRSVEYKTGHYVLRCYVAGATRSLLGLLQLGRESKGKSGII